MIVKKEFKASAMAPEAPIMDYLVIEDTGSIDRTAAGLPRDHPLVFDQRALGDAILSASATKYLAAEQPRIRQAGLARR